MPEALSVLEIERRCARAQYSRSVAAEIYPHPSLLIKQVDHRKGRRGSPIAFGIIEYDEAVVTDNLNCRCSTLGSVAPIDHNHIKDAAEARGKERHLV